ncbi:MAG: hypothetical protein J6A15_02425 [Clostridia bacterium]|nr:hypothetical protein [Clostridia bacterium]
MKKSKFLFIALVVVLTLNTPLKIFAEQQDNNTQQMEDESQEKEQTLQLIDECLNDIEIKLNNIDKKIEYIRLQEEFAYYPAIRLNVDSPILGMNTVVENRLRVKKDISTSDVASKYSIRDIVKNRKIKLPESYLGSIVVSTVEVNIDSSMELSQAKLTLVKCIQYLSQVNSAYEFVNNQTNKIFKDYIADDKKTSIKAIKDRNLKLETDLELISDQITIMKFLGKDVSTYSEQYSTISTTLYEVSEAAKNQLILDDDLVNLSKKSVNLEASVIEFKDTVQKAYNTAVQNMDYALFLENVYEDFDARTKAMDKYITDSTTEVKVEDKEKSKDNEEDKVTTDETKKDEKEEIVETIVNYEVTSNATLDYMEIKLDEIETLQDEYKKQLDEAKNKETDNKENTEDEEPKTEEVKELTQEEKNKIFEENETKIKNVYSKYKEVLSREYKFYTNNINMLLKDSNDKISSIIAEIDSGIEVDDKIFNYTKYIYIDLPDNLTEYLNKNNLDSMIEMNNLITLLKKELGVLSKNNISITKMYNDMLANMLES